MPNVTVRRAEARDSNDLAGCIDAAYAIYTSTIEDLPPVSEGIADAIERHRVWVAEMASEIIGGMILVPHDDFLQLENIAVHPKHSGMGLGRALINRAEQDCLDLDLHEIRLSTHEEMPKNIVIYSRLGWKVTSRSGNKVYMSKEILA